MITKWDIAVIAAGYVVGLVAGFVRGLNTGKDRFWRMPGSSWRVRR